MIGTVSIVTAGLSNGSPLRGCLHGTQRFASPIVYPSGIVGTDPDCTTELLVTLT